jgi:3-hydroxy-9,10-secoandrosta-1,3,5(10)-triene-9,17-dione monooxygenase
MTKHLLSHNHDREERNKSMVIEKRSMPMSGMTHKEAVARARAPVIRERAARAEEQRRQPEETIQAIVDAGLVRLLMPRRWGGYELSYDALADSAIEIARADASAGWCYSFLVAHASMLAHFPDEAQSDVWISNPDALIATSLAPVGHFTPVEGGYRLTGNWPWSSGVDHSEWCMLAALPASMDGPFWSRMAMILVEPTVIPSRWILPTIEVPLSARRFCMKQPMLPMFTPCAWSSALSGTKS